MFVDLIKGRKASKPQKQRMSADNDRDEMSDERLDEIMAELFGTADDDRDEPAPKKMKKGSRYDLEKAIDEEDYDDMEDEEEEEDMEKGMSRREMMNQVYSMVDDLSDEELDSFLSDRQIKKAQVMAIFEQMPTSDLKELVSARAANGAEPMSPLAMSKGDDMDYDDEMDDEEDI